MQGRDFVIAGKLFRPCFASVLTGLAPGKPFEAVLDQLAGLGFNGVRVFGGSLGYASQTYARAIVQLPIFLKACRDRGLHVEFSAICGSGDAGAKSIDLKAYIRETAAICASFDHTLFEIANEPYHGSQAEKVHDFNYLLELAALVPSSIAVALGATKSDEVVPPKVRHYITEHLDRSRSPWEEVRRTSEQEAVESKTGKPVLLQEHTKADSVDQTGKLENSPEWFFTLGANLRIAELGACFHSEDGLNCRLLDPISVECAKAFRRGFEVVPSDSPRALKFNRSAHDNSVVRKANFHHVTRVFVGIDGGTAYAVLNNLTGDPEMDHPGWRVAESHDEAGPLGKTGIRTLVRS